MMQPPTMGVVPGSMPVPGPVQGPVPVGPPGNHQAARIIPYSVKLVLASFLFFLASIAVGHRWISGSTVTVFVPPVVKST